MKTIKKEEKTNKDTRNSDKEIEEREIRFIHRHEAEQKLRILHKSI